MSVISPTLYSYFARLSSSCVVIACLLSCVPVDASVKAQYLDQTSNTLIDGDNIENSNLQFDVSPLYFTQFHSSYAPIATEIAFTYQEPTVAKLPLVTASPRAPPQV